jgi:hypothetical protein
MNRKDAEDTEILKEKEREKQLHRVAPEMSVLARACRDPLRFWGAFWHNQKQVNHTQGSLP